MAKKKNGGLIPYVGKEHETRGRPPGTAVLTDLLRVPMTPGMREAIRDLAVQCHTSAAAIARQAIERELRRRERECLEEHGL